MDVFSKNRSFYDQIIRLDAEELQRPTEVLISFREAYHLYEIRKMLWNLVETALTTENEAFEQAAHREALLVFYGQLEEVMEAVYSLH